MKVTATFIYHGMSDYWGGDGDRWDDNKGCLFAFYGCGTTLRDLIEGWVCDFNSGGDCDTLPEEVTDKDIHAALLDMLSDSGRADYANNAVSEFAQSYADVNGFGAYISEDGDNDVDSVRDRMEEDGCSEESIDDALNEDYDSPITVVLIECEVDDEEIG
jgi:hypothetical protein